MGVAMIATTIDGSYHSWILLPLCWKLGFSCWVGIANLDFILHLVHFYTEVELIPLSSTMSLGTSSLSTCPHTDLSSFSLGRKNVRGQSKNHGYFYKRTTSHILSYARANMQRPPSSTHNVKIWKRELLDMAIKPPIIFLSVYDQTYKFME